MTKFILCIFLLFYGCYTCPKDIFLINPAQIESAKIDTIYFYDHPYYILYLHDQAYPYDYLRVRYYNNHYYYYNQSRYFVPDTHNYYDRKEFEQRYNKLNRIDRPTEIKPTQKEIQKERQIWIKRKHPVAPKSPIPTEKKEDKND